MGKPYSMDLRERVIAAIEGGQSCHAAAKRFGVSVSTAIRWLDRSKKTGSVAPGQMGGHKPRILSGGHRDWLLERMKTDFTLRGLVAELATERGIKVDYHSVWDFVHAEGLSFKKKRSAGRAAPPRDRATAGAMEKAPGSD
jgi:transposase